MTFIITACNSTPETTSIVVTLIVDGRELRYQLDEPMTVGDFLANPDVNIERGALDRINPQAFTQVYDGIRITIVRVVEETACEREDIAFERTEVLNEVLAPGEERVVQAGQNGTQETCYSVLIEDGVPGQRTQVGQPTVITEPQNEIVHVGPTGELDPVRINGTLAYISNGNAWIIRTSSGNKRLLTTAGNLDQFVFSLSPDGRQLIYTTTAVDGDETTGLNQMWYISDTGVDTQPIALSTTDVLFAAWIPGQPNTISFSNGESRQTAPFWHARNDLWQMRIDPISGETLDIDPIIEASTGGLDGWWGTFFQWSPTGEGLAWSRADAVGIVDLESGELIPLIQYPRYHTTRAWSWRSVPSWSYDGELLITTVHGPPVGSEEPETSPAYNVAVTDRNGTFRTDIVDSAGMWATPQFSNLITTPDSEFPQGYLAYLQAREPYQSVSGGYDLVIADRDGSNPRIVFPPNRDQPGITTQGGGAGLSSQVYTWSPDGRQIAIIYQGNLWVIDAASGVAQQLTLDGGASNPVWTQ